MVYIKLESDMDKFMEGVKNLPKTLRKITFASKCRNGKFKIEKVRKCRNYNFAPTKLKSFKKIKKYGSNKMLEKYLYIRKFDGR